MDTNKQRLEFDKRHFGDAATTAIPVGEGALRHIQELTSGDMPTLVFDATGNQQSMNGSFNFAAHGGRVVFVGLFQGDITFLDPEAHRRELTLLCSRNATAADFKHVITALESGKVKVNPWVTHRVSFGEQFIGEFPRWLDPQSHFIKAVVEV
jgi:threonine dehydrogenase-like Zn-dependent dehydrogenase